MEWDQLDGCWGVAVETGPEVGGNGSVNEDGTHNEFPLDKREMVD